MAIQNTYIYKSTEEEQKILNMIRQQKGDFLYMELLGGQVKVAITNEDIIKDYYSAKTDKQRKEQLKSIKKLLPDLQGDKTYILNWLKTVEAK